MGRAIPIELEWEWALTIALILNDMHENIHFNFRDRNRVPLWNGTCDLLAPGRNTIRITRHMGRCP